METSNNKTPLSTNLIGDMLGAYENAQLVYVAAKLGLADLLSDGPRSSDELATQLNLNHNALRRVMRGMVNRGILAEPDSGYFALTSAGDCLKSGAPGDWRGVAINIGELLYSTWGSLMYSVETGKPAFEHVHGMKWFEYLEKNPEQGKIFAQGMANNTTEIAAAVTEVYDFSGITKVADIGGGQGILISQILKQDPQMQGLLFDAPSVIEQASSKLAEQDVASRCELVGGNFFDAVPAGYELYTLKSIIHDWNDEESIQILKNCRAGMSENGRVLLIEPLLPQRVEEFSVAVEMDLGMLLLLSGRERTADEYRELYLAAGLELTRVIHTQTPFSIIEGRPLS